MNMNVIWTTNHNKAACRCCSVSKSHYACWPQLLAVIGSFTVSLCRTNGLGYYWM